MDRRLADMPTNREEGNIAETEKRRKRLYFQCHHRGSKESDLLLGGFARAYLSTLSEGQIDRLEALLANNDADIYGWLTGRLLVPEAHDDDVVALLKNFLTNRDRS